MCHGGNVICCGFADPYDHYSENLYYKISESLSWIPVVMDGGRDSNQCWGFQCNLLYYQHEVTVPSLDSLRVVDVRTGAITNLADPARDWKLCDASSMRDELLIKRGNVLFLRDVGTGGETAVWSAHSLGLAQFARALVHE